MLDTIVALATSPLRSALSIIRLSGEDSFKIVSKIFTKNINNIKESTIFHGYIKDSNEVIDEVVLLAYNGPKSFTGEDSVEIICHGSPIIFNQIIDVIIKHGARQAKRGEFSLRAFMNNKLDLIQAESINDLINAETIESKNIALMSLKGESSSLIKPLREGLGYLLSLIEVNIDFPEYEDIEEANFEKIILDSDKYIEYINNLIKNGRKANLIRDGINVSIVGKPNVGKSSLLNALIHEDKAIVSSFKGTTRDIVEGKFILDGILLNLFDTAGIRDSEDYIEGIGINKSIKKLNESDLIIVLLDNNSIDKEDERILELVKDLNYIIAYNKADLIVDKKENYIYVSAKNNDISLLINAIKNKINISEDSFNLPSISSKRELALLEKLKLKLIEIKEKCKNKISIDLISSDIKSAYLIVLSILGEDHDFDISKEIFSRFCVGK